MRSPKFVNLHTHRPADDPDALEIESLYYGQELPKRDGPRSVGLHPWYLQGLDLAAAEQWLREQAARPDTIAIGEAGLDKATPTPWPLQVEAFDICLRVAAETDKPLIVHCVKAYGEVVHLLHRPAAPKPASVVFHGFDKHPQTAQMLLRAGCALSFGAALFREDGHAAEALRQTPAEHFFLETDVQAIAIGAVYARAAEIREVPLEALRQQVWENWERLSLHD